MTDNSGDALEKIFQKMESLEAQVRDISARMDALEPADVTESTDVAEHVNELPRQSRESEPEPPPVRPPNIPAPPQFPTVPLPGKPATPLQFDDLLTKSQESVPPASATTPAVQPKVSLPTPPPLTPPRPAESLEMRIATRWLPWVAGVFLALVLIIFAREHARGPVGKVVSCYLLSLGLIVAGFIKERKYPQWARPVLAAGLAFSYFTTYAVGFAEPMRLLDNLQVKLALLAVNLAIIIGVAQWKKSELMAGTALVLGFLTTGSVANDAAALWSCVALSIVALLFLWRNQWFVSTAVAAIATYLAYFYIWKAVPEAINRTAAEAFWYHFMFLTLVFLVYAAAGLIAKNAGRDDLDDETAQRKTMSRHDLLTLMTEANVAIYLGAIIYLLKATQLYWDRAWYFFFPLAAFCCVMVLLFRGLSVMQMIYGVAGALAFTLGLIASASPMWLPLFLALQAIVMLVGGIRKGSVFWAGLSFAVLVYSCLYLLSGGRVEWLGFDRPSIVAYPWWTHAAWTGMALGFGFIAEKGLNLPILSGKTDDRLPKTDGLLFILPYAVAILAACVWRMASRFFDFETSLIIIGAGVPLVAIIAAAFRTKSFVFFVGITAIFSLGFPDGLLSNFHLHSTWLIGGLGIAGLGAGWLAERWQFTEESFSRALWRILYIWAQLVLALTISSLPLAWQVSLAFTGVFAFCVIVGYLSRSAALGKSGNITVGLLLHASLDFRDSGYPSLIAWSALIIAAFTYLMSIPAWALRTGDRLQRWSLWLAPMALFAAGMIWCRILADHHVNPLISTGTWVLICALFAATGLIASGVWVALVFVSFGGLAVFGRLIGFNNHAAAEGAHMVIWGLVGVALMICAERVLHFARRIAMPWANDKESWIAPDQTGIVTGILAVATLILAVMTLRLAPDLRLFYFTGAMVGAAFVWIVLGFWFNEQVYRKSGFGLLCVGILKGLVWDVLSLKNSLYRQISWTVLGLLALAASFLYNKFRGRVEAGRESR